MKNVTITLDEATVTWARVEAQSKAAVCSRYIAELLAEQRLGQAQRQEALSQQREALERFLAWPGRICR
jgi:hypothetical protein